MHTIYELLGVAESASEQEIKIAFRRLAHKHHPDKGGDEETFKAINHAKSILLDIGKRAHYDRQLAQLRNPQPQMTGIVIRFGGGGFNAYGTGTSTTATYGSHHGWTS